MPDWTNIPWALLLPLTAGMGLVAFESAQWSRRRLTGLAAASFLFCAVGFAQIQHAPTAWSDAVLLVVTLVGGACLLCSLDDDQEPTSIGRQAAVMLFSVGSLAALCFATTLPTLLATFAAFIVCQSTAARLARNHGDANRNSGQVQPLVALIPFVLLAIGFVLLFALTRSTELVVIKRILQESYQPTRDDLVVGQPSFLGVVAIVLIVGASGLLISVIPSHLATRNYFDHNKGWFAVWMSVANRGFGFVLLWRVLVGGMPGFELDAQIILIVAAVATAIGGACLTVRSTKLRDLFYGSWIVAVGVLLMKLDVAVRQSNEINASAWHFPDVFETALIGFCASSLALLIGIACEHVLRHPTRRIDFVEDLAGLSKQRPLVAAALTISLLTVCAFPPSPGFWNVVFLTANAYVPQAEAIDSPVLVPNTAVLVANAAIILSIVVVAACAVDFFSMIYLHKQLGHQPEQPSRTSLIAAMTLAAGLLFAGVSPGTMIWLIHFVAQ